MLGFRIFSSIDNAPGVTLTWNIPSKHGCFSLTGDHTGDVRLEMTLTWTLMPSIGARRIFFLGLDETTTRWCPSSVVKLVYNSNKLGL
jgi:hypothetical protein